ncbi:M1 family metallopeptidase [Polaribacter sp. R77954]|uniref:M1 family metallopeptidase n=1 Tax=Polaribacter sp. R77954 TaxID=3093870 RepID=UPI0037C95614
MIKNYTYLFITLLVFTSTIKAQDAYVRNTSADVLDYVFKLHLNDTNNEISGETLVTVNFKEDVSTFSLDLMGKSEFYGMEITNIFEGDKKVDYTHINNKISITPSPDSSKTKIFKIQYHGVAEKGLVINKTKYGQRSFFGDNWPNLARHWLPCVDHPYDKASIEFAITAPEKYDVVATGKKIEESNLGNGYKLTRYKEPAPVATKVVTIGVTKFASKLLGVVNEIPVTAWVYPENRLDGFSDYSIATNVLNYYIQNIGPYSYAKLANIQAKTQWGGLENAGTITYFENSVNGKNEVEGLIAHEIAHQWFGNSATENSWNHVWLSEGFATYFTILYQEKMYGNEKRKKELALDKKQIIAYFQKNPSAIVDNSIKDPAKVLSTNTYQKGGWFLNMLRHKVGDEAFWNGIRAYYKKYRNSNAMTADFQKEMELVSNQNLNDFFHQWLFVKGYPELKWNWKYKRGNLIINIKQVQKHFIFDFPLEIEIHKDGVTTLKTIPINTKSKTIKIALDAKPNNIVLDPDFWLLFEDKN